MGFFSREDRELFFNVLAKRFNIKVKDENQKKQPLQIEMVRDNFNHIVSALKLYEMKQVKLEEQVQALTV